MYSSTLTFFSQGTIYKKINKYYTGHLSIPKYALIELMRDQGEPYDPQLFPVITQYGVAQQNELFDQDERRSAQGNGPDAFSRPYVPDHQPSAPRRDHQMLRQHEDVDGKHLGDVDGVQEVTLESLPHAETLVCSQRDHVTRRIG